MTELKIQTTDDYIADIRTILTNARRITCHAVNTVMVQAYWLIGKRIFEEEQKSQNRAEYGEKLLKNLSKSLTSEFGNGFSYANLKNMRQFYRTYSDSEIGYTLCSQLSWSHNRLIMRIQDETARTWYLKEAAKQGWSVRELDRNIQSFYYQRVVANQLSQDTNTIDRKNAYDIKEFIKDPYILEFVGLPVNSNYQEKDLEKALVQNLKGFLLELGKGYSFVGEQYRISSETAHFYIDLVFYNYILKCFVLIDLKTTRLSHQDVGQMDMYIRMFDDLKKRDDDNPTLGIILCADKDETIVKYSMLQSNSQMFAAKYLPYLPTEDELKHEIERISQLAISSSP